MSKNEKKSGTDISRRSFLKGVAATGTMAAVSTAHTAVGTASAGEKKNTEKSWRDKPDPIDERLISDGGTYDVVVVGGGNAGLMCARVAGAKGSSVAVLENQPEDGYVCVGTEVGTINSQYAMDHGAPRINEDDFIREWARRNVIRHNPKRTSYFAKNSGRILDWIIKDADKEWLAENAHAMSCPPLPTALTEVSGWRFYHGSVIFRKMTDGKSTYRWPELMKVHYRKSVANGAKWFFEHHVEICDLDDAGAVTGVVAKSADGKYFRFKARKGVALCAGDFSNNREMVIDILDELRHAAEAQGDLGLVRTSFLGINKITPLVRDGSSIKLGIWAGGHVEIGPRSCITPPGDPGTGDWHLQLDGNGERFCDEVSGTTLSIPADAVTVTLHDANWKKVLAMMPPRHGASDTAHTINWPAKLKELDDIKPGPPSKNELGIMTDLGTAYCGNTIEELFDYMDCYKGETRKTAIASVKRYNELCEKGVDEDFGKDPRIMKATALKDSPFYGHVNIGGSAAVKMFGLSPGLCATTGLDTDADGRVLNSEFKPIKGLYAAGNNAGGRFMTVYQSPMAGISIGMAITDGYLLGERLAALKV